MIHSSIEYRARFEDYAIVVSDTDSLDRHVFAPFSTRHEADQYRDEAVDVFTRMPLCVFPQVAR